jgi:predicted transcriptional regulator
MEELDAGLPPENDATLAAIAEGLAQARRGEFVPDEEMAAFLKSHGL